jgi:hypothetical protein
VGAVIWAAAFMVEAFMAGALIRVLVIKPFEAIAAGSSQSPDCDPGTFGIPARRIIIS